MASSFHFFFYGLLFGFYCGLCCNKHENSLNDLDGFFAGSKLLVTILEATGPFASEIFLCFPVPGRTVSFDIIYFPWEIVNYAVLVGISMTISELYWANEGMFRSWEVVGRVLLWIWSR